MIIMSKLLFWIPFIGIILFLSLYTKWNKYDILMLLSSFPSIYFMIQILEYSYSQPVQLFDFYLKGLAFSTVFYSILVFIIIKKKKQCFCFNHKKIIFDFIGTCNQAPIPSISSFYLKLLAAYQRKLCKVSGNIQQIQ